jgi:hypothetical protein
MPEAAKRPARSKLTKASVAKAAPKRSRRPLEERLPPGAIVHHNPHPKPFKPKLEVLPGTDVLELLGRGRDEEWSENHPSR